MIISFSSISPLHFNAFYATMMSYIAIYCSYEKVKCLIQSCYKTFSICQIKKQTYYEEQYILVIP